MTPYIGVMLRLPAEGSSSAVAAVELLIGHRTWLTRSDFVLRYVEVETAPELVGDTPVAFVRWTAAANAVGRGRLVCSGSEAQILRIAASIAEGVTVNLREVLGGLDAVNLGLVLRALARANGRALGVSL